MRARPVTLALLASVLVLAASAANGRTAPSASVCPANADVFVGTYHKARFRLLDPCKLASGIVREVKREEDGDLHIQLEVDPGQEGLLNGQNHAKQRGRLVLELMPRDVGHIPRPNCGWRIRVIGVWVKDGVPPSHGWREIHPIWSLTHSGKTFVSGPQFGGDPDGARSRNAQELCRTAANKACRRYPLNSCGT